MTALAADVSALAGLVVAAVFALAGALKLFSFDETEAEFTELGLPGARTLARVVPPVELAVAAAVLFIPGLGGPAAGTALGAFTAVLAATLRSGRQVSCGCLGGLSRGEVTNRTLVRNGVLMALALLVTVRAANAGPLRFGPHLPPVDLLVGAGALAVVIGVVGQLLTLRRSIGRMWSVELAGETDRTPADPEPSDAEPSYRGETLGPDDHPSSPVRPEPRPTATTRQPDASMEVPTR